MRRKLIWGCAVIAAVTGAMFAGRAAATPASGFVGSTIAKGRFEDIAVMNHSFPVGFSRPWVSIQKTIGPSDLYVQNNVWVAGGSTGWHTHPGQSLIVVTAGTVTAYEGDDPACTPHVYTTGMGFVDPGGDHVHLLRNEGTIEARTVAVQLVPADAVRRIDAPAPGSCPF